MTSKQMRMKLFAALAALAAAACNVDEAGKIRCADDSSCPSDYPVCGSGVCIAGTSTTQNSVAVIGVPGKQSSDPVRGTVTVQVAARASTGVASVALSTGAQSFSGTASTTPGVFNVPVDTTKLAEGTVTLTATVTAGNGTTITAQSTILVDNTVPGMTVATVTPADARLGTVVLLDVTPSEPVSSLTATVKNSANGSEGLMAEVTAPTGNTRHFGFGVAKDVTDTYTVTLTPTDLAGNVGTPVTRSFNIHGSFALGTLTLTGAATQGGLPAVSGVTGKKTLTGQFTLPVAVALGGNVPVVSLTIGAATRHPVATAGAPGTWNFTYDIVAGDVDGSAVASVTVTDVAGSTASASKSFVVDKTAPALSGISQSAAFVMNPGTLVLTGVASEKLGSATVSSDSGDGGACLCDGGTCSPSASANSVVTCTINVTNGPPATALATVVLTDVLGNQSAAAAPQQATYTVVGFPSGSFLIADTTVTVGTSALLNPGFGTNGFSGFISNDQDNNIIDLDTTPTVVTVTPAKTTVYTLNVKNQAGVLQPPTRPVATVTVVPKAIITVAASPANLTDGDSFIITATVPNAGAAGVFGTVSLFQNASGDCLGPSFAGAPLNIVGGVGTAAFPPLSVPGAGGAGTTVKYCVSVNNVTGTASPAPFSVKYFSPPTITSFVANTPVLAKGGTTTFTQSFTVNGGKSSIVDDTGTAVVPDPVPATIPITVNRTTTYTLTVANGAGKSTSRSITVEVLNTVRQTVGTMTPRSGATATVLFNGKVLIAGGAATVGGTALDTAVIFDPVQETFTPTGTNMGSPRRDHTAHLLTNGSVLIVGGFDALGAPLGTVETFDPAGSSGAGAFAPLALTGGTGGGMVNPRALHTSTVLTNGTLLVAGGCGTAACGTTAPDSRQTAEIIDIGAGTTTATSAMKAQHVQHTATLLASGNVLIAGGATSAGGNGTNVAEVFNGAAFACTGTTCSVGQNFMTAARAQHAAVLLPNGNVALFGGKNGTTGAALASVETFDPGSGGGTFSANGATITTPRFALTATRLGGAGRIFVAGGFTAGSTGSAALSLFDVSATTTLLTPVLTIDSLTATRGAHTATLLFDTTVLVTGGTASTGKGELFTSFQ